MQDQSRTRQRAQCELMRAKEAEDSHANVLRVYENTGQHQGSEDRNSYAHAAGRDSTIDVSMSHGSIRLNICPAILAACAPGTPCTRTMSRICGSSEGDMAMVKPSPGARLA